ncbi:hypothetical protein, conserved [Eimeria praecox]|uniref:Uncharacterized protein n=1 Tax=Eimeria praecox TaxID=51316 RepID=U6H979_9EIME|nr:hypothetical protein, conserved [Eimeria praecox]
MIGVMRELPYAFRGKKDEMQSAASASRCALLSLSVSHCFAAVVRDGATDDERPTSILLHPTPVPLAHQTALLEAAETAFAGEERVFPGIFESHARTLLLVLHGASCAGKDPREVLRTALAHAGLVTGVLDEGGISEASYSSSIVQSKHAVDSWEAVASAEAFVSDVQRLEVAAERCVTTTMNGEEKKDIEEV